MPKDIKEIHKDNKKPERTLKDTCLKMFYVFWYPKLLKDAFKRHVNDR